MNKKALYAAIVIVVVACLAAGGYVLWKSRTAKPSLDPLNASYMIDGTAITLVNGKSEREAAPGSHPSGEHVC